MQICDNDAKSVDDFWEQVNGINTLEFLSFKQVLFEICRRCLVLIQKIVFAFQSTNWHGRTFANESKDHFSAAAQQKSEVSKITSN